jgi:hypothetical protein
MPISLTFWQLAVLLTGALVGKEVLSLLVKKYFTKIDADYVTVANCLALRDKCGHIRGGDYKDFCGRLVGIQAAMEILLLHSDIPVNEKERVLKLLRSGDN